MELDLRILPLDIYGVKIWSVEDRSGFTYFYCDTKEDAQGKVDTAQENFMYYANVKLENR